MANVLGFFAYDKEWVKEFFVVKDSKTNKPRKLSQEEQDELMQLIFISFLRNLRFYMLTYEFEKNIYENPDQDFDKLFNEIQNEYTTENFASLVSWTQRLVFFSSSDESVYYQNYILSFIVAAQVHAALKERFGNIFGDKRIGEFLKQLYRYGASRPWEEVVEEVTGKPVSADDLIEFIMRNYQEFFGEAEEDQGGR